MSEQNGDHSPRKVGGDDQQSVPASQPLRQLLDIAVANAQSLGLWLLLPLAGFIVLVYAAANGSDGLHIVTGVLTLLISLVAACVPLIPRIKDVQRGWLVLPLAGAAVFLYFVNQGLNDPWGGGSWWVGLLIFAATIYVALTPQIHSFGWTDLGATPNDVSADASAEVLSGYDMRMRAIARFTARTIMFTAVLFVIAGGIAGGAGAAEIRDLVGGGGGTAVGALLGIVAGGVVAQFWLGFASIVWFVADIARHTRAGTGVVQPNPSQSSSPEMRPLGIPASQARPDPQH